MTIYIYLGMKGVVVFALPILIMFPFRKQLPILHCCLDCSEVLSELHHGECSLQVSFSLVGIISSVQSRQSDMVLCPFLLAWSLHAEIAVLVLSSSFTLYLCFCTPLTACSLHAFSIRLWKLLHWAVRQICCTLISLNKIFVKIY